MTVQELIDELQKCNPDKTVLVEIRVMENAFVDTEVEYVAAEEISNDDYAIDDNIFLIGVNAPDTIKCHFVKK